MTRIALIALTALALTAPLTACGKKGNLERPSLTYTETR